jgi:hypothetical protein
VSVGGFASVVYSGACDGLFCNLYYVLLALVASCGCACYLCGAAQRKYQARLTTRLGLGLYDADDEV